MPGRVAALLVVGCLGVASIVATTDPPRPRPASSWSTIDASAVDDRWDDRVVELVAFVEAQRRPIRRVATVEFVPRSKLELAAVAFGDMPDSLRLALESLDDLDRALGIETDERPWLTTVQELQGDVVAFYQPQPAQIVVALDADDEPMTFDVRTATVLVHELTHAHQASAKLTQQGAFRDPLMANAVIEGEAEWVMKRFVEGLAPSEAAAWHDFEGERRGASRLGWPAFEARFVQSYALGYRLHQTSEQVAGDAGVDEVFASARRSSTRWLLDPFGPATEDGGHDGVGLGDVRLADVGRFVSAFDWYLAFAATGDPTDALLAARQITSVDSPRVQADDQGRLCFTTTVSTTLVGRPAVVAALASWTERLPSHRTIDLVGDHIVVEACDPGVGEVPEPRLNPFVATEHVAMFIDAERWLTTRSLDRTGASCIIAILEASNVEPSFSERRNDAVFDNTDLRECRAPDR